MKNPEELRESLIDDLDQFDKDYLIKSIICFLDHSQREDLKDSINEVQYQLKVLIGSIVLENHHSKWSSQHTAIGNKIIDEPKNSK